jgi:predicted phage-related endonuclease
MKSDLWTAPTNRQGFVGGSDARIIMGSDEAALIRLWREKRGEVEPQDVSGNLIVQLGSATEELNRSWYERNTGRRVRDVQRRVRHSAIAWMVATLDGIVEGTEAVFESKFMLPWSFSEEAAAEKYMAQVQHNMWVTHLRNSVLSIITDSRSASASSKAFNVSSTVPRTTRSRWLLIRSSSIVMTLFSGLSVSSDMAAPSRWPGCV